MENDQAAMVSRLQEALVVARRIKAGRYTWQPADLTLLLQSLEDFERWVQRE